MRRITALLLALLLTIAPVHAEPEWFDASGGHELTGALLFALHAELPPASSERLRAVRNQAFADEAAFRAALGEALLTAEFRAAWLDRLVGLAASGGASFGIETRASDLLTIIASVCVARVNVSPTE